MEDLTVVLKETIELKFILMENYVIEIMVIFKHSILELLARDLLNKLLLKEILNI